VAVEGGEVVVTTAAWIMLTVTWSVVGYFTGRFFLTVLKTPIRPERAEQMRDGILEKDA
jgi:hypothetical protein